MEPVDMVGRQIDCPQRFSLSEQLEEENLPDLQSIPIFFFGSKTKKARQTNVKIVSLSKYVTMQMYVNVDDR